VFYAPVCYLLLWGGSVWFPVSVVAGFAVLAAVFLALQSRIGVPAALGAGLVAAVLWWAYLDAPAVRALSAILPIGFTPVPSTQFGGFLLAITIGVTAISFSLPLGILLALGRQSNMLIIKALSVGFIEFIRGVPLITLLFTASLLLQYFLPPGTNFDIILRVIILVTFFAAAYLAEVIRGGLAALPRGQYEAAASLGLDYWQAQRLIILPQALKISIPGIVSTFIGLFKDTTLVSFVGLMDPLRGVTQIVRADINWKGIYWEPYVFVGAVFFLMCYGMSRYSMYLEQTLRTDHR
jgi:general L-amino acid transport system permease protein